MQHLLLCLLLLLAVPGFTQSLADEEFKSKTISEEFFIQGLNYKAQGMNDFALKFFERSLKYDQENWFLYKEIGEIYSQQRIFTEAISNFKKALHYSQKDSLFYLYRIAQNYRRAQKQDSAKVYFKFCLNKNSTHLKSLYELSFLYEMDNDLDSAVLLNSRILKTQDYPVLILKRHRELLIKAKRKEEVHAIFTKAWENTQDPNILIEYIDWVTGEKDITRVNIEHNITLLREAHELYPNHQDILTYLLDHYLYVNQHEASIPLLKKLIHLDPQTKAYQKKLALLLFQTNRLKESTLYFTRSLELDSMDHELHFYLSTIHFLNSNYPLAKQHINNAISIENNIPYLGQKAIIYQQNNQLDTAALIVDDLLQKYPDNINAVKFKINFLSHNLSSLVKDDTLPEKQTSYRHDLILLIKRGLEIDPENKEFLFDLGVHLERTQQIEESVKTFKQLVEIDSTNAMALNYLGYTMVDYEKNLQEGLGYIERALQIDPQNAAYLDSKAWYYYKKKEFKSALDIMLTIPEQDRHDVTILEHFALVYQMLSQPGKATHFWKLVQAIKPDHPDANFYLKSNAESSGQ